MDKTFYKCTNCGEEIVVMKAREHKLPKVECESCGTMTMRQQKSEENAT